jgi:hypothetical protein
MIEILRYTLLACQLGLLWVAMRRAFVFMKFYIGINSLTEAECYRQWSELLGSKKLKNTKINEKHAGLIKSLYLIDINKKINTNLIYALILTAMIVMW